ncbi:hypothetical protein ACFPM0_14450 [Pseudonocardia sulfidoxydans]
MSAGARPLGPPVVPRRPRTATVARWLSEASGSPPAHGSSPS